MSAGRATAESIGAPGGRLPWADVAKAVGMALVFEGHLLETMVGEGEGIVGASYQFIYAFHMPLFFLISGMLASRKALDLRRRVVTRLGPFLFFDLLSMALWVSNDVADGAVKPGLYAFGLLSVCKGYPFFNAMLWFLVALFVVELVDLGLRRALKTDGRVFAASWLVFGLGVAIVRKERFFVDATGLSPGFWWIKQSFLALPFYEVGVLLKRSRLVAADGPRWAWLALFLATGALLVGLFDRNRTVNLGGASIGVPALFVVNGLLGSLMILALARLLPPTAPVLFVGRNTLALLGLNGILTVFVNGRLGGLIARLTPDEGARLALTLAATVGSLIAVAPAVLLLNRFAPWVLGKPSRPRVLPATA